MSSLQRLWLTLGLGWVALVVYLSLANIHIPQGPVRWSDKLNHFLAYGFLMGWFGQLYFQRKTRFWLAISLIALGILMEVLQGQLPYRWFEVVDALANTGGVLLACLFIYFGADRFLTVLEQRFG